MNLFCASIISLLALIGTVSGHITPDTTFLMIAIALATIARSDS